MPLCTSANDLDSCMDTFSNLVDGQAPQVGLQVLKLAMKSLMKEGFLSTADSAATADSLMYMFEFSKCLEPVYKNLRLRVELVVEPVSLTEAFGHLLQSDTMQTFPSKSPIFPAFVEKQIDIDRQKSGVSLPDVCKRSSSGSVQSFTSCPDKSGNLSSSYNLVNMLQLLYSLQSAPAAPAVNEPTAPYSLPMPYSPPSTVDQMSPVGLMEATATTEVYVDGLPFEATRNDVYQLFSQVGEIVSIHSAKSGCAFVQYATVDAARRAISDFNLKMMPGYEKIRKPMRVSESRRQENPTFLIGRHLHVMNLPPRVSQEQLMSFFSQCGAVATIRLPPARNSTSQNKGYGFVTYYDQDSAALAIRLLSGKKLAGYETEPRPILLDYAKGCKPTDLHRLSFDGYLQLSPLDP